MGLPAGSCEHDARGAGRAVAAPAPRRRAASAPARRRAAAPQPRPRCRVASSSSSSSRSSCSRVSGSRACALSAQAAEASIDASAAAQRRSRPSSSRATCSRSTERAGTPSRIESIAGDMQMTRPPRSRYLDRRPRRRATDAARPRQPSRSARPLRRRRRTRSRHAVGGAWTSPRARRRRCSSAMSVSPRPGRWRRRDGASEEGGRMPSEAPRRPARPLRVAPRACSRSLLVGARRCGSCGSRSSRRPRTRRRRPTSACATWSITAERGVDLRPRGRAARGRASTRGPSTPSPYASRTRRRPRRARRDVLGGDAGDVPKQAAARTSASSTSRARSTWSARSGSRSSSIDGIGFLEDSRRMYPSGELACQVLGFVGVDDEGLAGHREAVRRRARRARRAACWPSATRTGGRSPAACRRTIDPVDGHDIVLTIDKDIQYQAQLELAKAVKKWGRRAGRSSSWTRGTARSTRWRRRPAFNPNDYGKAEAAGAPQPAGRRRLRAGLDDQVASRRRRSSTRGSSRPTVEVRPAVDAQGRRPDDPRGARPRDGRLVAHRDRHATRATSARSSSGWRSASRGSTTTSRASG